MEVISVAIRDVAKRIRQRLRNIFPGVTFSVRIERFSTTAIDVYWIDGPTSPEVERVTSYFKAHEQSGASCVPAIRVEEDQQVHVQCQTIFLHRIYTAAMMTGAAQVVASQYNRPIPAIEDGFCGCIIHDDYSWMHDDRTIGELVREAASKISVYEAPLNDTETLDGSAPSDQPEVAASITAERNWIWITFSSRAKDETVAMIRSRYGASWSKKRRAWYITTTALDLAEIQERIATCESNDELIKFDAGQQADL